MKIYDKKEYKIKIIPKESLEMKEEMEGIFSTQLIAKADIDKEAARLKFKHPLTDKTWQVRVHENTGTFFGEDLTIIYEDSVAEIIKKVRNEAGN